MMSKKEKTDVRRAIGLAFRKAPLTVSDREWLAANLDRVGDLPVTDRWSPTRHRAVGKIHFVLLRKKYAFEIEAAE